MVSLHCVAYHIIPNVLMASKTMGGTCGGKVRSVASLSIKHDAEAEDDNKVNASISLDFQFGDSGGPFAVTSFS